MSSSLSSLADNLAEELHDNKCTDYESFLEYISTKDELLIFNCLKCSKHHKEHNWTVGNSIIVLTDMIIFRYQTAIKYTIHFLISTY